MTLVQINKNSKHILNASLVWRGSTHFTWVISNNPTEIFYFLRVNGGSEKLDCCSDKKLANGSLGFKHRQLAVKPTPLATKQYTDSHMTEYRIIKLRAKWYIILGLRWESLTWSYMQKNWIGVFFLLDSRFIQQGNRVSYRLTEITM